MRVLVTGAAGYLGRAVCARLLAAGHEVTGMVRSSRSLRAIAPTGVAPVLGSVDEPAALRAVVAEVDAVIDTTTADSLRNAEVLLEAISGRGVRYLRTSGSGIYSELTGGEPTATVHTEETSFSPHEFYLPRLAADELTRRAGEAGEQTVVLRPAMVYGHGGSEQLPVLLHAALREGVSRYTGAGLNQYGNVYLDDLAEAYLLALTHAPPGSVYNLAAGECTMREIATGVASVLGLGDPISVTLEESARALGPLYAQGMAACSRVDSSKARAELGWTPQGPPLMEDLIEGSYRRVWGRRAPAVAAS